MLDPQPMELWVRCGARFLIARCGRLPLTIDVVCLAKERRKEKRCKSSPAESAFHGITMLHTVFGTSTSRTVILRFHSDAIQELMFAEGIPVLFWMRTAKMK